MAVTRMIQVTYGSTGNFSTILVPSETKVSDFVAEHSLSTQGATLQLNSKPVSNSDMSRTLGDLVTGDSCYLFSVVNAKNA